MPEERIKAYLLQRSRLSQLNRKLRCSKIMAIQSFSYGFFTTTNVTIIKQSGFFAENGVKKAVALVRYPLFRREFSEKYRTTTAPTTDGRLFRNNFQITGVLRLLPFGDGKSSKMLLYRNIDPMLSYRIHLSGSLFRC